MANRLKAVESEASDEEVEEQFTMQLEQLIKQCDDELGLIPQMAEWKPWDVPAGHKVGGCLCCNPMGTTRSLKHARLSGILRMHGWWSDCMPVC